MRISADLEEFLRLRLEQRMQVAGGDFRRQARVFADRLAAELAKDLKKGACLCECADLGLFDECPVHDDQEMKKP